MITIKRFYECTMDEIVQAWNAGFEEYFVPIHMNAQSFFTRMIMEGLSFELSIVAFDDRKPIGIVVNGIRNINGKKVAWNGGTGVAVVYRKKGIGKMLLDETLKIYEEEQVSLATLEAISENVKAISLYEKKGYKIIDWIGHFSQKGLITALDEVCPSYSVRKGIPRDVSKLSFYNEQAPWQTHWQSAIGGESIILVNDEEKEIAYAIYKRVWNEQDEVSAILLYQIGIHPDFDNEEVAGNLLKEVFQTFNAGKTFVNLSLSNKKFINYLKTLGFEEKVEQVYMIKEM